MWNLMEIKNYHVIAGSDISNTIENSIIIAKKHDCIVKFNFNSVEMEIFNFSNIQETLNYYHKKLKG